MHKKNNDYGSWLYYEKRTDDIKHDSEPPGELSVTRLIHGKSDYWTKGASQVIRHKKTLLLCDWSLHGATRYRFEETKKKLKMLLQSDFVLYLWQNESEPPLLLTKELIDTHTPYTKGVPQHIDTLHQTMGGLGVSPDELTLLDEHSLDYLHNDAITPYVIHLSQFRKEKYTPKEMLDYVKSLSVDFVFNQDELSINQIEWLDTHIDALAELGVITFNYRSVTIYYSLITRWSELSHKLIGSTSRNLDLESQTPITNAIILEVLKAAPNLEELNVLSCYEIEGSFHLEKNTLPSLKKLDACNSTITKETLCSLIMGAPNLEELNVSGCNKIEGAFNLKKNTLPSLKKLNAYYSSITKETLCSLIMAAPNLEELNVSRCNSFQGTFDLEKNTLLSLKKLDSYYSTITKETLCSLIMAAPNIEELNVSGCKNIEDSFNLEKNTMPSLKKLDSRDSTITGETICSLIMAAPNLEELNVSGCKNIEGAFNLEKNTLLSSLKKLDAYYSTITKETLYSLIMAAPNIEELNVSGCKNIEGAFNLEKNTMHSLKKLDARDSTITSEMLCSLVMAAPNLEELNISSCKSIEGAFNLEKNTMLPSLKKLDACKSTITSEMLCSLMMAAPNLEELNVSSCQRIQDSFNLDKNTLLPLLKKLDASYSTITSETLCSLMMAAPNLEQLNISNCHIIEGTFRLKPNSLPHIKELFFDNSSISYECLENIFSAAPALDKHQLRKKWKESQVNRRKSSALSTIRKSFYDTPLTTPFGSPDLTSRFNSDLSANQVPGGSSKSPRNPTHNRESALTYTPNTPYQYNRNSNALLNQGMIINQLSYYLELTNQHLDLIPKIQAGICKPLTNFFLSKLPEGFRDVLDSIKEWDGHEDTLTTKCQEYFNELLRFIRAERNTHPKETFIGEALDIFIHNASSQRPLKLSNPWHQIGLQWESSQQCFSIYDPNYIDGPHLLKKESLSTEIRRILGPVVSVDGDYALTPYQVIKNIETFLFEGGFLLLSQRDNMRLVDYVKEQSNAFPKHGMLFEHTQKASTFTKKGLSGLLLKATSNHPAWLLGLYNAHSHPFFIDCIKQFIELNENAKRGLIDSIEGLAPTEKEAVIKLIDILISGGHELTAATMSAKESEPKSDSTYVDTDTEINHIPKVLKVKHHITCLSGPNPDVSAYRKTLFDSLTLTKEPTNIKHAFILSSIADIQLTKTDVSNTDCELADLGEVLSSTSDTPIYIGTETLETPYEWLPLPSISPSEQMSHLHLNPTVGYDLRYSMRDNLYYICIKSPIDTPITVQYLFKVQTPIKQFSLSTDISTLIDELKQYGDKALQLPRLLLTGAEYLERLMTQKVGSCRHRVIVFKAFMMEHFSQIPCRILINDCHAFAEVKIDGQWLRCDLGGYPAKLRIEEPALAWPKTPNVDTHTSAEEALLKPLTESYRKFFKALEEPSASEALASNLLRESNKKHLLLCDSESLLKNALTDIYQTAISEHRPIFWVTKPSDLLCQLPFIQRNTQDNSGQVLNGPGGPLYDFLIAHQDNHSKPVLLIDYSSFKPHDIVRFNQLLDDTQKADGVNLPNDITIIGVQNKRHPHHYTGDDFSSRFDKKYPIKQSDVAMREVEPHDEIDTMSDSNEEQHYIINLYDATNWEERLTGYWQLDGQQLTFVEGELTKALKSAQPITILNAPEDTKPYQLFLKKLEIEGALQGLPFTLETLRHAKGYEWDKISLAHIHLHQLSNEDWLAHKTSPKTALLLNPSTHSNLFSSYYIDGQAIRTNDGILKTSQGGELTLYLSRDLSESQWAELIDSALDYNVKLNLLALPHVEINDTVYERLNGTARMTDDTETPPHPSPFIVSSDPEASARARLDSTTHIIDISELPISDLFLKLDGRYDAVTQGFIFSEEKRLLLRELEKGHKFILTGDISEEKLDRLLPYLYQYREQLILILKTDTITPPENYLTESPSLNDKCHLLSHEEQSQINYLLLNADMPLFTQETLSKLSFSQLKAFLAYQANHPDNLDINAAWVGIEAPAPQEINTSLLEKNAERETTSFIRSRHNAINTALSTSPLTFISGVTGCGKSAFIDNHLIQTRRVYLHSSIDTWARDPEGGILFIDEANISQQNYTLFEGLFADTPFIILNDEYIELTPNHKILMAGNPASYGGSRHTPSILEQHGNAISFDIMPPNVLFQLVVKPLFHHTPFERNAFNLSTQLLEAYQWLLQHDREACHITPRDIKAVVMRTLANITPDDLVDSNASHLFKTLLNQQLRTLIIPKLPKNLVGPFEKTFPEIKIRTKSKVNSYGDFIITDSRRAVSSAIDDSLTLRRYRQANQSLFLPSQLVGDLSAIVLESEPGLGKTELVKAKLRFHGLREGDINTIEILQNVYYNIPVTLSIKQKKEMLLKAFIEGNVIIIDEINSSPMLEQFLNNLLMGQIPEDEDIKGSPFLTLNPTPGFTVLGTQNPIHMQGRVNASIAENARRINYTLEPYTKDEILQILTHKGLPDIHANALIDAYLSERNQAIAKHHDVIPNFRDVLRVNNQMIQNMERNTLEGLTHPMDTKNDKHPLFNTALSIFKRPSDDDDKELRPNRPRIGFE